jgi:hypothetical protein
MTGYSTAPAGAGPSAAGAGPGAAPSATGRLLDEVAGLMLPVIMPLVRRLPAMILVLAGLITLTGVLALVGAHRDDAAIDAHRATATAQVLPGSDFGRTLIAFTTAKGDTVVPERGVYYPRGLQPGQNVRVEYDTTHPDRVRVGGRTASVGTLPLGMMLLGVWLIALPVGFSLRGRQLRRIEAAGLEAKAKAVAKARAESRNPASGKDAPAAVRSPGSPAAGSRAAGSTAPGSTAPGSRAPGSPAPGSPVSGSAVSGASASGSTAAVPANVPTGSGEAGLPDPADVPATDRRG